MLAEKIRERIETLAKVSGKDDLDNFVIEDSVRFFTALAKYADGRVLVRPKSELINREVQVLAFFPIVHGLGGSVRESFEHLQKRIDQRDGRVMPT